MPCVNSDASTPRTIARAACDAAAALANRRRVLGQTRDRRAERRLRRQLAGVGDLPVQVDRQLRGADVLGDHLQERVGVHGKGARDLGRLEHAFYLTAAMVGLRLGEMLALRWRDVDFDAGVIRVRRSYRRTRLDTPKMLSSDR